MKLSGAIRIGAAKRPQAFGAFAALVYDVPEGRIATCALGAAYEGLTGDIPPDSETQIFAVVGKGCSCSEDLLVLIVEWNDEARLTREEIAYRVEAHGL